MKLDELNSDLTAAAVLIDEKRHVRASTAIKLIGVSHGQRVRWESSGRLVPLRRRVEASWRCSHGVEVYYPLDQLLELCRSRLERPYRLRWRRSEIEFLKRSIGHLSIEAIAQHLGRTPTAVEAKINSSRRQFYLRRVLSERGRFSTSVVAAACGRTGAAIRSWIKLGLASWQPNPHMGDHFICLEDLRKFLREHPLILAGLTPFNRRRLGLSADPRLNEGRAA